MITLQFHPDAHPHCCATCRSYRTKEHHPSEQVYEPYCGLDGALELYVTQLQRSFCVNWERLPDKQAVLVYEQLTGLTL